MTAGREAVSLSIKMRARMSFRVNELQWFFSDTSIRVSAKIAASLTMCAAAR